MATRRPQVSNCWSQSGWPDRWVSGRRQPSPSPGLVRSVGAAGPLGGAGFGAAGGRGGQPPVAVGPVDDRPGAGGGLAAVAFAVQLDDDVGAQGGVLLPAAGPLIPPGR